MLYPGVQLYTLRALTARLASLCCVLWLAGCAAPFQADRSIPVDLPQRAAVQGVPLIQQADFYCGPASIAMVMQWAGSDITQDDVAALAFSPGAGGTYLADMLGSSRRLGQLAVTVSSFDQLLREVAAGTPVIVFQNLGIGVAPVWHYGVVTGYDLDRGVITLNSGQRDEMIMPVAVFRRTWARGDDWGLIVLPPDRLPVTVPAPQILAAAAALERVDRPRAAARLYQTGAARWPGDWLWEFGLGNALYAQGDLAGAGAALRRALLLAPDVPEIRANLDFVEREIAS